MKNLRDFFVSTVAALLLLRLELLLEFLLLFDCFCRSCLRHFARRF